MWPPNFARLSRSVQLQLAALACLNLFQPTTVFAALICPGTLVNEAGELISVPRVIPKHSPGLVLSLARPALGKDHLDPLSDLEPAWIAHKEIVTTFVDELDERSNWSQESLAEKVPQAYAVRSRTMYTQVVKNSVRVGTLGMTWANFDPKIKQLVPAEMGLETELPRPKHAGIIFEVRTWSINKKLLTLRERLDTAQLLFSPILTQIFHKLQDHPKAYNERVIYLFADEPRINYYGKMYDEVGFKKISETPIPHAGSNWWIMSISPRELEQFLTKIDRPVSVTGLNLPLMFRTDAGSIGVAPGESLTGVDGGLSHRINGNVELFYAVDETEIAPGLWVKAGSKVVRDYGTSFGFASQLSRPYLIPGTRIVISSGGEVAFANHRPKRAGPVENDDTPVAPGIWANKGSYIEWSDSGQVEVVTSLSRPFDGSEANTTYMGGFALIQNLPRLIFETRDLMTQLESDDSVLEKFKYAAISKLQTDLHDLENLDQLPAEQRINEIRRLQRQREGLKRLLKTTWRKP